MNPMILMQLHQRIAQFQQDHPKFPPFLEAVKNNALKEGTIVDIKVTSPEGTTLASNIKLTTNDIETIKLLVSSDQPNV